MKFNSILIPFLAFLYSISSTTSVTLRFVFSITSILFSLDKKERFRPLTGSKNLEAIMLCFCLLGCRNVSSICVHAFQIPLLDKNGHQSYIITIIE